VTETLLRISVHADLILAEIDADITAGLLPVNVAAFSDLHGHVDANDYALAAVPFTGPSCVCDRSDTDPGCYCAYADAWAQYMEYLNAVEAEVDRRLKDRTGT
jgi:hypothetical protein